MATCSSCRAARGCVRRRSRRKTIQTGTSDKPQYAVYDRFATERSLALLVSCYVILRLLIGRKLIRLRDFSHWQRAIVLTFFQGDFQCEC